MNDDLAQKKPLISLVVFSYNQEKYIRLAVEAALAQDYSPLEIVLSDDCSSDETFTIMSEIANNYSGPHVIRLNRNEINLGVAGHVDRVARMCKGELLIVAAGDDISKPERTTRIVSRWLASDAKIALLYSDFTAIDSENNLVSIPSEQIYRGEFSLEMMAKGDIHVLGATMAMSTMLFSEYPPMESNVRHEDRVLPFRVLLSGGEVILVDEKLVDYRIHGGVSRGDQSSFEVINREFIPKLLARTLPDAEQRLSDAIAYRPDDNSLMQECIRTIASQNAMLTMANARGLGLESALCAGLIADSRPSILLKYYTKLRFSMICSLYFKYFRKQEVGYGS